MREIKVLLSMAAAKNIETECEKIDAVCGDKKIEVPVKIMSGDTNSIRTDLHYEIDRLIDSYEDMINPNDASTKIHIWRPKGV